MILKKILDSLKSRLNFSKEKSEKTASSDIQAGREKVAKEKVAEKKATKKKVAKKKATEAKTSKNKVVDASPARKPKGDGARKRKQQLVIGLDFGTAFTKVVIGEERVKLAVPFNDYVANGNPYLLPSILSISKNDDTCKLGFPGIGGYSIEDLKIKLINHNFNKEVKTRCAAFLSLVLRHARDWVLRVHKEMYRNREIVWYVNTGVPTASYEDEELKVVYQEIVRAAWMASFLPEETVSLARVGDCFDSANSQSLPDDRINIFPEFAVQLMGYIESPQRQEDLLHVLVDIGAGTLDLAIFNVHRSSDGEYEFPVFTKSVKPLGTRFFIQECLKNHLQPGWKPSLYEDVPSTTEFKERLSLSSDELKKLTDNFKDKIATLIIKELKYTENKRVRRRDKMWDRNGVQERRRYDGSDIVRKRDKYGVLTFLCGGGACVDFYQEIFSSFEKHRKIRLNSLTKQPKDLDAEGVAYDRLSVAYGLSLDPANIAEIIKSQDIKDYEEDSGPSESYTDRYIGSEQV